MKAVRLYAANDLRVEDVPDPQVGSGDVLVRTKNAFVCGTDVRMYKNGKPGIIDPQRPRILGHEIAGTIEAVGRDVESYKPGMRVAIAPNFGCGICDRCVGGNTQLCRQQQAIGIHMDGAFAEYVLVPAPAVRQGNIFVLPDNISFNSGALAEPFSCVYNAYEQIGIFPGDVVLIIGAGPIGVMHAKIANLAGAGRIYMNDLSTERLTIAQRIVPSIETIITDDLKGEIDKRTKGTGVDLVITAASVAAIQEAAFSYAGTNGRIMFFGGLPKGKSVVQLDTNEIHYKQLTVSGTTMQSLRQYRKILRLMEREILTADDIVTGSESFTEVVSVIDQITSGSGLKTSLTFP
jgi:L-iditol 2-dehydrogenase